MSRFDHLLRFALYLIAFCVFCLYLFLMNSTPNTLIETSNGVSSCIEQLQHTLNQNYLRTERTVGLRQPNTGELRSVLQEVEQICNQFLEAFILAKVDNRIVAAVKQNKSEFDVCKDEWLYKLSGLPSSSNNELFSASVANEKGQSLAHSICLSYRLSTPSHSTKTSKSSRSTTISVKRSKAEKRLRIA